MRFIILRLNFISIFTTTIRVAFSELFLEFKYAIYSRAYNH